MCTERMRLRCLGMRSQFLLSSFLYLGGWFAKSVKLLPQSEQQDALPRNGGGLGAGENVIILRLVDCPNQRDLWDDRWLAYWRVNLAAISQGPASHRSRRVPTLLWLK